MFTCSTLSALSAGVDPPAASCESESLDTTSVASGGTARGNSATTSSDVPRSISTLPGSTLTSKSPPAIVESGRTVTSRTRPAHRRGRPTKAHSDQESERDELSKPRGPQLPRRHGVRPIDAAAVLQRLAHDRGLQISRPFAWTAWQLRNFNRRQQQRPKFRMLRLDPPRDRPLVASRAQHDEAPNNGRRRRQSRHLRPQRRRIPTERVRQTETAPHRPPPTPASTEPARSRTANCGFVLPPEPVFAEVRKFMRSPVCMAIVSLLGRPATSRSRARRARRRSATATTSDGSPIARRAAARRARRFSATAAWLTSRQPSCSSVSTGERTGAAFGRIEIDGEVYPARRRVANRVQSPARSAPRKLARVRSQQHFLAVRFGDRMLARKLDVLAQRHRFIDNVVDAIRLARAATFDESRYQQHKFPRPGQLAVARLPACRQHVPPVPCRSAVRQRPDRRFRSGPRPWRRPSWSSFSLRYFQK